MEPDSLLVRGLVDNASGGLSPALDRSTTFDREPGGSSPYGRGHAPVAAEAEALLGALEDAEATVFASGMTAWTCLCLTVLGEGSALALPTSGYYSLEGFATGILERFGVELRRFDIRDRDAFPPCLRRRRARDRRDAVQPAAHADGYRAGRERRARRWRAPVLRQHVRDAAPAAPTRSRCRSRLAERHEVPRGALRRARRRRHDAPLRAARAPRADTADDRRRARARRGLAPASRPAHAARAPAAPGRQRIRARAAAGRASRRARGSLPRTSGPSGSRARAAPDARRRRWRAGLRAGRRPEREAVRGRRAARTLRNQPRRRRDADRVRARLEPEGRVPDGLLRLSVGLEDVDDLWADLTQAMPRSA